MPKSPKVNPPQVHPGKVSPRLRRQWLAEVIGCDPGALLIDPNPVLTPGQSARFDAGMAELANDVPLARVQGWQSFWGLRFALNEATLDPRDDSEVLVEAALADLPNSRALRVLDLGTGSGCLLLSILHERPLATGLGVDLSQRALEAATGNASALDLGTRARFAISNWFDAIDERFDLILCNPPYVANSERDVMDAATLDHDPHSALFAPDAGLAHYSVLFKALPDYLTPGGFALFEHGYRQQDLLVARAEKSGLQVIHRLKDFGEQPRALLLRAKKSLD